MTKLLGIVLIFFSTTNAFGIGSQTGGFGKDVLLQVSLNIETSTQEANPIATTTYSSAAFNWAVSSAAKDLSAGDVNLEGDLYQSFNPRFVIDLLNANPQLDMYSPAERVRVLAKISTGVSYLDKSDLIDGAKAIKALSSQRGLLEDLSEMDLIDIWEASQGVKEWSL